MKKELWWTYIADYEGKPGSTIVDMALKNQAPIAAMPIALVTGVSYESPDKNDGLPNVSDLDFLNQLSEKRVAVIRAHSGSFVHVGTFTNDHKRYDYFYLANPTGLEEALQQFYRSECPNRVAYVNIKDDSQWERYLLFLYPNQPTIQFYRSELEKIGVL